MAYKPKDIDFIPISAFEGDNITKASDNTKWYKGPSLVEALQKLSPPEKPTKLPLRVPVQDVYSITGVGTVPVGRVETGIMKKGDNLYSNPRFNW